MKVLSSVLQILIALLSVFSLFYGMLTRRPRKKKTEKINIEGRKERRRKETVQRIKGSDGLGKTKQILKMSTL